MVPYNRITLGENAEDFDRIGPNKRNKKLSNYKDIEYLMDLLCPLTVSFDVSALHPPYFYEYTYVDVLDGISILTQSAEINARMAIHAANDNTGEKFPFDDVVDKYELLPVNKKYNKVVFLPAFNAMRFVSISMLQKLMFEDSEWMIKLHPVSEDELVRSLAAMFGYNRLIDRNESGMEYLKNAKYVATTDTSEFLMLARFLDKPVFNLTDYVSGWQAAYHHIGRLLKNTDDDVRILNNIFTSSIGGHIRASYDDAKKQNLIMNYFNKSMNLRENFKMIINQQVNVTHRMMLIDPHQIPAEQKGKHHE